MNEVVCDLSNVKEGPHSQQGLSFQAVVYNNDIELLRININFVDICEMSLDSLDYVWSNWEARGLPIGRTRELESHQMIHLKASVNIKLCRIISSLDWLQP